MTNLEQLVKTISERKIRYLFFESFIFFVVILLTITIYLVFLNLITFLPQFISSLYSISILSIFVFLSFRFYTKAKFILKNENILFEVCKIYPFLKDRPINSWQLLNKLQSIESLGISKELAIKFIEETDKEILNIDINKIIDFKKLYRFLNPAVCILIVASVLYFQNTGRFTESVLSVILPWSKYEFKKYADVFPGNINIPSGSEIEIKVKLKQGYELYSPEIFTKSESSNWQKIQTIANDSEFISEKIWVVSPLQYFVKLGSLKSETFTIETTEVPKLVDFKLKCYFPSYTGIEPKETDSFEKIT
ncbi:MAG: hypothetical protein ACK4JE_03200, partial [Endomicrobiia bacterium]